MTQSDLEQREVELEEKISKLEKEEKNTEKLVKRLKSEITNHERNWVGALAILVILNFYVVYQSLSDIRKEFDDEMISLQEQIINLKQLYIKQQSQK